MDQNPKEMTLTALKARLSPVDLAAASLVSSAEMLPGQSFRDRFVMLAGLSNEVALQERLSANVAQSLRQFGVTVPEGASASAVASVALASVGSLPDSAAREVALIEKAAKSLQVQAAWTGRTAAALGVVVPEQDLAAALAAAAVGVRDQGQVRFFADLDRSAVSPEVSLAAAAAIARAGASSAVAMKESVTVTSAPLVMVPGSVKDVAAVAPDSSLGEGAASPVAEIQAVLAAPSVAVTLEGPARPEDRGSLLCVAGQAVGKRAAAFGVDGVDGKFRLADVSLEEVHNLHKAAGGLLAEESVRSAMGRWLDGKSAGAGLPGVVSDEVRRTLNGPVSMASAESLVESLRESKVYDFGAVQADKTLAAVLKEQGVDVRAPSLEDQAASLGYAVVAPDREKGLYVGPVVAQNHVASVVKFSRDEGIVVAHSELGGRPGPGEMQRIQFKGGEVVKVVRLQEQGQSVGVTPKLKVGGR